MHPFRFPLLIHENMPRLAIHLQFLSNIPQETDGLHIHQIVWTVNTYESIDTAALPPPLFDRF